MKLLFEKSVSGRKGVHFPSLDVPLRKGILGKEYLRKELPLPCLSEVDVNRHFVALSRRNYGIDLGFYPLGSCTMKYNPKVNEDVARLPGFANMHPFNWNNNGCLELMDSLSRYLEEITGMKKVTLQPAAGAHGELTGLMITKAYFKDKGEDRKVVVTPDSSHGTNPASSTMCGFETVQIKSGADGLVDLKELQKAMNNKVAVFMLTNPNTLGLFEKNIKEICKIVHDAGALVYCDGANMNAITGICRPGDMGFDIIQLNLHKTFSTPHGGGGPGCGPVGVCSKLVDFLPGPIVEESGFMFPKKSIGRVKSFYGNFGMMVRAYTYIRYHGPDGLKANAENAVLNANYLRVKLMKDYHLAYNSICKHEFVLSDKGFPNGVTTSQIAKRIIDYGMHPPTIYFPLIVHGALMIEPTETEGKDVLDNFVSIMLKIKKEASSSPDLLKNAPSTSVVGKLDEVKAVKQPNLCYKD
jgi:glycine dehydrogenase subunit 2